MMFLFFGLTIAALILFNSPAGWRRKRQDPEVLLKELQAKNLLVLCGGRFSNASVIEPEVVARSFDPDDFGTHRIPE